MFKFVIKREGENEGRESECMCVCVLYGQRPYSCNVIKNVSLQAFTATAATTMNTIITTEKLTFLFNKILKT